MIDTRSLKMFTNIPIPAMLQRWHSFPRQGGIPVGIRGFFPPPVSPGMPLPAVHLPQRPSLLLPRFPVRSPLSICQAQHLAADVHWLSHDHGVCQ